MKKTLQNLLVVAVALAVPSLAFATDPAIDYGDLAAAAVTEVGLAIAGGVVLFGAVFGIKVGIRVLKSFASA